MQTEAIRHELEKQIDSSETKTELHNTHSRQPVLRPFDSGTDIVAFLRRTDIKGMQAEGIDANKYRFGLFALHGLDWPTIEGRSFL